MRLDHLIATVPDIRTTHSRLLAMGFEEAWPVGPFWPEALTSGVALGGVNLELIQPDQGASKAWIDTLVLAPADRRQAQEFLPEATIVPKVEPDARLLALRGFPSEMVVEPQLICENLYPEDAPYPFFLCLYASFLKGRLAPENFASPRGPLIGLDLSAPEPEVVRHLFAGRLGPIELNVDPAERAELTAIRFADGSSLSSVDL